MSAATSKVDKSCTARPRVSDDILGKWVREGERTEKGKRGRHCCDREGESCL